jgi:hypothetical protein
LCYHGAGVGEDPVTSDAECRRKVGGLRMLLVLSVRFALGLFPLFGLVGVWVGGLVRGWGPLVRLACQGAGVFVQRPLAHQC